MKLKNQLFSRFTLPSARKSWFLWQMPSGEKKPFRISTSKLREESHCSFTLTFVLDASFICFHLYFVSFLSTTSLNVALLFYCHSQSSPSGLTIICHSFLIMCGFTVNQIPQYWFVIIIWVKSTQFWALDLVKKKGKKERKEKYASKLSHYKPHKERVVFILFAILRGNSIFEEEKLSYR